MSGNTVSWSESHLRSPCPMTVSRVPCAVCRGNWKLETGNWKLETFDWKKGDEKP
ncbi:hypothetical protein AtDm6_1211 [Acetobacter tropicalis]|uniref:Uncharacterized protein n=1 Tax=Acetobacter tropicalis TaxID=104102 RepID=A0A094ZQ65_9PROT|nr:hypothetical protein AtDm6_1211 [Acetobacter tropicalis]